ncbi:TIGR01456 family HAD hydrolase [Verruconis gallopava]|uniref:TIGR01456 family HAD hydrolase n=1 Tax=Verruconis gallopava TaxID=253628 RepID=A0A0D2ALF4_9PEZI|nr:TIGR01456 family HAD hydrolase [Verruconis gallopava]KIW07588.1 TIGR01456 family HAD hydrolase [Verruconis gallopava]
MAVLRTAVLPLRSISRCAVGFSEPPALLRICSAKPQRWQRYYSQPARPAPSSVPEFGFAFDIDGVLLRASKPIPGAHEALSLLQSEQIPFILLTNGGGKTEQERVDEINSKLGVQISTSNFMQSHTPFADLAQYKDKTILVLGGDEDKCRSVAENYGFGRVIVPGDLFVAEPSLWPFSRQFLDFYRRFARPLPKPLYTPGADPSSSLKIDAVFVYNDPRDWGLDATIVLDLLLSKGGVLGTISAKNGDASLPNRGYQQDGQPPLYFSNPDLFWAAKYHLPRLGQGGFREALEGLWAATTGGEKAGVRLVKQVIGKPYAMTYAYAEGLMTRHREQMIKGKVDGPPEPLKRVYMVGDNPESDIKGGNDFKSPVGTDWWSILVRTGVHQGGEPKWKPRVVVDDVYAAVKWALQNERWTY